MYRRPKVSDGFKAFTQRLPTIFGPNMHRVQLLLFLNWKLSFIFFSFCCVPSRFASLTVQTSWAPWPWLDVAYNLQRRTHGNLQLKFQFRTFASNNLHFIFYTYTLYNLQRWTDGNLQLKFQLTAFTSYAHPLCNHYSLGYKIECKWLCLLVTYIPWPDLAVLRIFLGNHCIACESVILQFPW